MAFVSVNWLAILMAAVAAWIFGAIYYGILGKSWLAAQGKTMESMKIGNAGKSALAKAAPFILSFVAEVVMAWALHGILLHMGLFTLRAGIVAGALIWFGFVLTTVAVNNAFSGRKPMLTAIDAGHWLGVLIIAGAVIGWFGR
jgi:Protein of unknown function (DUF1761)